MKKSSLFIRIRNSLFNSRRRRIATIDISDDGFLLRFRRREARMRWADVTRIDAGVRNYLSFDGFYVVLIASRSKIEINELDDGFRQFEGAVFLRWPEIRDAWNKLLKTNPHELHHETLWRRGS